MPVSSDYEQYLAERRQFDAFRKVADEHAIPWAASEGAFKAYRPHFDSHIETEERSSLRALGSYGNRPEDYKVHINPADEQLFLAFARLVSLARQSSTFREAMYEVKVWIGGAADTENDDIPRLVLYPREGLESNAYTIIRESVPWLGGIGISGSGRVPRFNLPITDGFAYIAQGSGYDKEESQSYLGQFDEATGYALIDGPSAELRDLTDDIKKKI